jgi:uncharacterized membrane protein
MLNVNRFTKTAAIIQFNSYLYTCNINSPKVKYKVSKSKKKQQNKNKMILNAALALLFYVCGHGFLFQSCSIGNPQYAPEVWHQTPGTFCIAVAVAVVVVVVVVV